MKKSRLPIFVRALLIFALVILLPSCFGKKNEGHRAVPLQERIVRVEARQFAWDVLDAGPDLKFGTADDIQTENLIVLPAGCRVHFELISKDVIHGFWIPRLGIRQTLVPGPVFKKRADLQKVGQFKIACSDLCGVGHAKMVGWLRVLPQEEYQKWLLARKYYSKGG